MTWTTGTMEHVTQCRQLKNIANPMVNNKEENQLMWAWMFKQTSSNTFTNTLELWISMMDQLVRMEMWPTFTKTEVKQSNYYNLF